jgi:hypothetical protein
MEKVCETGRFVRIACSKCSGEPLPKLTDASDEQEIPRKRRLIGGRRHESLDAGLEAVVDRLETREDRACLRKVVRSQCLRKRLLIRRGTLVARSAKGVKLLDELPVSSCRGRLRFGSRSCGDG